MIVTCDRCHQSYDDARCWKYCPHDEFISDANAKRHEAAMKILGRYVGVPKQAEAKIALVLAINGTGLVTLEGYRNEEFDPADLALAEKSGC